MTRWVGVVLALAAGCGDEPETFEEQAQGAWVAESIAGCAEGFTIDGAACERRFLCALTGGGYGVEVERGDCFFSGTNLLWTVRAASCSGVGIHNESFAADLRGKQLVLTNDTGTVVYSRPPELEQTGRISAGCFAADGAFTANAVREL